MDLAELQEIAEKELAARKPIQDSRLHGGRLPLVRRSRRPEAARGGRRAAPAWATTVQVCAVGCMRLCCEGPLVQVDPEGSLFERVSADQAPSIVAGLNGGKVTARRCDPGRPFFTRQKSIVLENSGLDRARAHRVVHRGRRLSRSYQVVREMNPAEVIDAVTRSGLRGRGGAGYPTGLKWAMVAKNQGPHKYVVCNADEGDPGAFMDRSVLESDPHRVLEGMAIAAYAVGADQGYIYVRGEYPLAIRRLETGIRQARRLGLLGTQIFESPFNFRVDVRIGAGRVRVRRGDRASGLDRGPARHAAAPAALPGRRGPLGKSDAHQQRRDLRQYPRHHPQRAPTGSRRSAPRRARGPRSSPWPARSATPGWSRCRWEPR